MIESTLVLSVAYLSLRLASYLRGSTSRTKRGGIPFLEFVQIVV